MSDVPVKPIKPALIVGAMQHEEYELFMQELKKQYPNVKPYSYYHGKDVLTGEEINEEFVAYHNWEKRQELIWSVFIFVIIPAIYLIVILKTLMN
jgi:hypothetical protein